MPLNRTHEQAVSVIARVDAVLHIEAQPLAAVLDHPHDLTRKSFQLEWFGDLGVEPRLGRTEGHPLHVEFVADDRDDVLRQLVARQRDPGKRLAHLQPRGVAGGEPSLHRLARARHVGLDLGVLGSDCLGKVRQVDRSVVG